MSLINPNTLVTEERLAEFYQTILPYLGASGGASTLAELGDVKLTSLRDTQVIKWDATQNRWVNDNGGGNVRFLMQTLSAGSISVKFTNLPTTGNNVIDFFTTNGMNYTKIDTSVAGEVTLTYESQLSDVIVYCRIEGVV